MPAGAALRRGVGRRARGEWAGAWAYLLALAGCDARRATLPDRPPTGPALSVATAGGVATAPPTTGVATAPPPTGVATPPTPDAALANATAEVGALAPLADASWLEPLPMERGHAAFVSVPLGATEARPVVVAVHGAGDRAEWACGGYRAATDAYPFIVCPQGLPDRTGQKFTTAPPARLIEDIDAAVAALTRRFGRYVAGGPMLYAGFSLGAIHGAKVLTERSASFPKAVLIEGGYTQWTTSRARAFVAGGGYRVALVCGQSVCPSLFADAERTLVRSGAGCRLFDTRTGRHNLDGEMMHELHDVFRWVVADDPRWRGFVR